MDIEEVAFGNLFLLCEGQSENPPSAISISDVRTVRVHDVCSERTLPLKFFWVVLCFEVNVRPYQTPCTRTAGHWISEKSAV